MAGIFDSALLRTAMQLRCQESNRFARRALKRTRIGKTKRKKGKRESGKREKTRRERHQERQRSNQRQLKE